MVDAEPVSAFDDAVALAAHACGALVATLAFFETRRQWFKAAVGVDLVEGPISGSLNASAVARNENILVVSDIAADGRFAEDPVLQARPSLQFYAGVVLTTKDGAPLGVLGVYDEAPRADGLDADQTRALLSLAGSVMRELESRKASSRTVEPAREDVARGPAMSREMSDDQIRKALLLSKTVPFEVSLPANRMTLGDNARELLGLGSSIGMARFREHVHADDQALFDGALREAMTGVSGEADVRFKRTRGRQARLRVRAEMLSHFSLTGTFVDVTAEAGREDADEASTRDHLTGVLGRGAFQARLQKEMKLARMYRTRVAVLFIDIDGLEDVNAAHGHHCGDEVLREAARRIMQRLGNRGEVGRARADEFAVLLRDLGDVSDASAFGEQLLTDLRAEFVFEGNVLNAASSAGAAVFPDHQRDLARLLQSADAALKVAKTSGRDRISVYSAQDARELERRARELQALRAGLGRNDILPFYQPVFDLASGEVVGVEALARWRHPSKGVLAADYFQAAFENSATAADITDAMLRAIMEDGRRWSAEGLSNLRVSLNLGECELRRQDVCDRILSALAAASFPPALLEVEAPEAAFVRSGGQALRTLEQLRSAGVRVALDNFGKASASLNVLRTARIDRLKIDRSLTAGLDVNAANAAIVSAMIALARDMNTAVTAEGVETIPQLEKLRSFRCQTVQGYLLGAPMVGARIPDFARRLRASKAMAEAPYAVLEEPDPFAPSGRSAH